MRGGEGEGKGEGDSNSAHFSCPPRLWDWTFVPKAWVPHCGGHCTCWCMPYCLIVEPFVPGYCLVAPGGGGGGSQPRKEAGNLRLILGIQMFLL